MCEIDWTAVAAWVQAIGSILAIVAAIWIGERSAKQSRDLVERERKRQADIVASTISTKLHLIGVELEKKSHMASVLAGQVRDGKVTKIDKDALNKLFLLDQADALSQLRAHFTLFDRDTGIIANTTWDVIEGYNPTISSAISVYEFMGSKPDGLIDVCDTVVDRMNYIASLCSETEERLESVHELNDEADRGAP